MESQFISIENNNFYDDAENQIFTESPISLVTSESFEWYPIKPLTYSGHWASNREGLIENNGYTAFYTLSSKIDPPVLRGGPLENDYIFDQLHFHWSDNDNDGSEHSINGKKYASEAHLVHYNSKYNNFDEALNYKDGVAVTSFMFRTCDEQNPLFANICRAVLEISEVNKKYHMKSENLSWIPNSNLDEYFTYYGSLTTEPFSKSVTWIIHTKPINISFSQMNAFRKMEIFLHGQRIRCNVRSLRTKPKDLNIRHVSSYFSLK